MTTYIVRPYGSAPRVAALHETFPTTCPIVQQVRTDYADWYYDIPEGYLRYYKGAPISHYEHRLVDERIFGPIPAGHIVRHLNNDRADNRCENLRVISRSEVPFAIPGHEPASAYQCAICGHSFQAVRHRLERSLSGQLFCSPECRQFAQRKVARPTAEELRQLMHEVGNWTALAQQFGVSDNAVRKWAKRYGLALTRCNGRRKRTALIMR